jgi:hypothetical protein
MHVGATPDEECICEANSDKPVTATTMDTVMARHASTHHHGRKKLPDSFVVIQALG